MTHHYLTHMTNTVDPYLEKATAENRAQANSKYSKEWHSSDPFWPLFIDEK
jgi:hypothetical protein